VSKQVVETISLPEARFLSLVAQRLECNDLPSATAPTSQDLLEVIRAAGCLQLDSISVVSRAHETAVWSRVGHYNPVDLAALHHPHQALIEYWAHAASLLPVEFLPYLRRKMLSASDPNDSRVGRWAHENRPLLDDVLATIAREGPLSTRAFERPEEVKRQPWDWWGGKPAKQALDALWTLGELVILRRNGFERVYELTDRAFPDVRTSPLPAVEEEARFFSERALSAVGIGTTAWIADYFRFGSIRYVTAPAMQACLEAMEREGRAVRARIDNPSQIVWLDIALLPALSAFRAGIARPVRGTLLSPFDNLLWRRDRALALFGFDYRLESYTPEPKRIYGYYSLPILIEGLLLGRLDARYRRKERLLSVQSVHLEPGIRPSAPLATSLANILRQFTTFLGGGEIEVVSAAPSHFLPMLKRRVA
jgi:uncharacterized protein YcaQ